MTSRPRKRRVKFPYRESLRKITCISALGYKRPPHRRGEEPAAIATAVAQPCEETSLKGAVEAGEAGLIKPILVGPKSKIDAVAKQFSINLGDIEIVDV